MQWFVQEEMGLTLNDVSGHSEASVIKDKRVAFIEENK